MSEAIREGDVRTYPGVLTYLWVDEAGPCYTEGSFRWCDPHNTPCDLDEELDLTRVPKYILREAWNRVCNVTVKFLNEDVEVVGLEVVLTTNEQVVRVLRLAAEMMLNSNRDYYDTLRYAAFVTTTDVRDAAFEALNAYLRRTGRLPEGGYVPLWTGVRDKDDPSEINWNDVRAEQMLALLATASEIEVSK